MVQIPVQTYGEAFINHFEFWNLDVQLGLCRFIRFKGCTKPKFKLFFDCKMFIAATIVSTQPGAIFKQGSNN